jgi:hypothetical protein
MKPSTVASPCFCVAASTSFNRHPGPTRASFVSGLTVTSRMRDMSSVRPPSVREVPPMLWPPPLMLSSTLKRCAKRTAVTTSRTDVGWMTSAGVAATIPFQIRTTASQPSSPGRRSRPSIREWSSSSCSDVRATCPPSSPARWMLLVVVMAHTASRMSATSRARTFPRGAIRLG